MEPLKKYLGRRFASAILTCINSFLNGRNDFYLAEAASKKYKLAPLSNKQYTQS